MPMGRNNCLLSSMWAQLHNFVDYISSIDLTVTRGHFMDLKQFIIVKSMGHLHSAIF